VVARVAQIAQIIIWAVLLVLGVFSYWRYLEPTTQRRLTIAVQGATVVVERVVFRLFQVS
jgi:hypothetical protein